jgi:hypothetical protein
VIDMPNVRMQVWLIVTIAVAVIIAFSLFSPFASATSASPKVCLPDGSGSTKSSDGSMYLQWNQFVCSGKYEGQLYYEAFSGQKYTLNIYFQTCGKNYEAPSVKDFANGQAAYSSGTCEYAIATNFPLNQESGWTFPIASGSLTVSGLGWSGNCNTYGSGSACSASISS